MEFERYSRRWYNDGLEKGHIGEIPLVALRRRVANVPSEQLVQTKEEVVDTKRSIEVIS